MKKIFVVMLALFLAVPALSYAGSATSRFDMTIGGQVNFNFGYITKGGAANDTIHGSTRESTAIGKNLLAEQGNVRYSLADSAINFRSHGPNVWGAKTTGFLQIDFRGTNTGNNFGGAQVHMAFIKLDWANTYLIAGQTGPELLSMYARKFIVAGDHSNTEGLGGARSTILAMRHSWTKNFNTMLGFVQNTSQNGATGNVNSYGRGGLPNVMTEIGYQNEACGKIGPDMLKFGLGALLGKEKKTSNTNVAGATIVDDTVDVWMAGLRGFVPIIPEKKGNKAGALALSGIGYMAQNANSYIGGAAPGPGSYWRGRAYSDGFAHDAVAPTVYGGSMQLTYYVSDKTYTNAYYGAFKINYSDFARRVAPLAGLQGGETDWKGPNLRNQLRIYGLSIFHDPSPNTRIGFEWIRMYTNYNYFSAASTAGSGARLLENYGEIDNFKAMIAYYF